MPKLGVFSNYYDYDDNLKDLTYENFPGNCGVSVIYGFDDYSDSDLKHKKDKIIQVLLDTCKNSNKSICLASINHRQVPLVSPILVAAGFTLACQGNNHRDYDHNDIAIYTKVMIPSKRNVVFPKGRTVRKVKKINKVVSRSRK